MAFSGGVADAKPPVRIKELLKILRIQVFRVRLPRSPAFVCSLKVLTNDELKPMGKKPSALTRSSNALLSLRNLFIGWHRRCTPPTAISV